MKKIISLLLAFVMIAGMMIGCGSTEQSAPAATEQPAPAATEQPAQEEAAPAGRTADPNKQKITFGITASFQDFTDYIPEKMAEWGYEVELVVLDSPVVANTALDEGSVDVNYIQHLPYLLAYNESNGTSLYPCEPYIMSSMDCLVSLNYSSIDEIPDGASIAIADDASNLSVNLEDLASIGLITLADIPEGSLYTIFDIVDNPKNLELVEMDMYSRYSALNGDVDLAMGFYTNTSQAKYGFNLLKLFEENIAYPQVIAVREEDKDAQWVEDFIAAFTSQEQVDRINAKNEPNLAWKILFEVSEDPFAEAKEETAAPVRTADPNKKDITFGITASFGDFTDYIPAKMAEWGYNVELVVLDSPVVANTALDEGSIDVNYIQHLPYLLAYNESNGTTLTPMEPYIMSSMDCLVSMKYSSIDEIPDGASIAIADDASNLSVNLEDLASIGLITLADIPEGSLYTTFDIVENPKNLELVEMDMYSRYSALNGDVDLAMGFYTNTSQAKYGFNLLKLFDENIAYPQVVAVRAEDKDAQWVQDFMAAFTSQEQVDRINAKNDPNLAWKILFEVSE